MCTRLTWARRLLGAAFVLIVFLAPGGLAGRTGAKRTTGIEEV
jgi:hypothetical protein